MKKHETFSIRFLARANRSEKNSSEKLYARITVAGERTKVSLGREIDPELFDQNAQHCLSDSKEARGVNNFLDTIKYKLNEYRRELMEDNKEFSADSLKRKFMGLPLQDEIPNPTILELY